MSLLNTQERKELLQRVCELGFDVHMIAETGSKAWGTDVETSDHDLTVIATDTDYDIYKWPRTSNTFPIQFKDQKVDVRIFSIEHFLRKVLKSNLVAYEAIYSEWHYGDFALQDILKDTMDKFYDPRELFRSSRGNLSNIRAAAMKGRRQLMRYSFMCLQLVDNVTDGRKPLVNVHEYFASGRDYGNYDVIRRLYDWAMNPEEDVNETLEIEKILVSLADFNFPSMVDFKQGEERAYMNVQFAKIKALVNE